MGLLTYVISNPVKTWIKWEITFRIVNYTARTKSETNFTNSTL